MTIGRGHSSDIRIASHYVSRVHAKIRTNGIATIIEDAGSKNGLLVNSERVQRRVLHHGDVVSLGGELNLGSSTRCTEPFRPRRPARSDRVKVYTNAMWWHSSRWLNALRTRKRGILCALLPALALSAASASACAAMLGRPSPTGAEPHLVAPHDAHHALAHDLQPGRAVHSHLPPLPTRLGSC